MGKANGSLYEFSVNDLVCLGLLCVILCSSFEGVSIIRELITPCKDSLKLRDKYTQLVVFHIYDLLLST